MTTNIEDRAQNTVSEHESNAPPNEETSRDSRSVLQWLTNSTILWFFLSAGLIALAWQLATVVLSTPAYILPTPGTVAKEIGSRAPLLAQHSVVTLREILLGYGLSVAVGVSLGAAIASNRWVEKLVYPMLVTSQSVPKVAIAPLFLIWMGYGALTNATIALLVAVFPITINTALGLGSVEPNMIRLGRVMGASRLRLYWRIRIPYALPSMFAGFKLGIALAVIGAVVGEFVAGSSGLGYLAQQAAGTLNTELAMASIVCLSVLGVLLFFLVELVERVAIPWHSSQMRFEGT